MTDAYFVTSSGTEIGKTYITASMCRGLISRGKVVGALKPIMSGFEMAELEVSDAGQLLDALGLPVTPETVASISPWRFEPPISPDMAAKRAGIEIDLEKLLEFCRAGMSATADQLFIEAAGGIMAPINDQHTMLDWAEGLSVPLILVVGSYLGTISHTLSALEAIRSRGLEVKAVIISESPTNPVPVAETASAIGRYTPVPIRTVTRNAEVGDPILDLF